MWTRREIENYLVTPASLIAEIVPEVSTVLAAIIEVAEHATPAC
jgi:hypothetical protein